MNWTMEYQLAFETIKEKLANAPVLGLPNPRKPFKLYIHESKVTD